MEVLLSAADGWRLLPDFTVVGLVLGGIYALAAVGLVLIYRVSGVLNFAHGAIGMFGTFVAYQFTVLWHLPVLVGLVAAIATGAMLGLAVERLTMRPLDRAPPLSRVVVTIGWLLVLQTAAGLIWGDTSYHQAVRLVSPAGFRLPGTSVIVGYDQLTTLLAALGLALATAAVLRWTSLGLQLRAVADDPFAARLWGIKVDRIRALSWMTGSAMAAIAGVLITPRVNFTTFALTLVVLDAFAAALIGRLVNLPAAVGGALVLGLAQTYPTAFVSNSGVSELVTFLVVLAALWLLFRPGVVRTRVA